MHRISFPGRPLVRIGSYPSCLQPPLGKNCGFRTSALVSREYQRQIEKSSLLSPRFSKDKNTHRHTGKHSDFFASKDHSSRQPFLRSKLDSDRSTFARQPGPPPKRNRDLTPSQEFMEERNRALLWARQMSEKNARQDLEAKQKAAMRLKDKGEAPKPVYTYRSPKLVPGDVAELFGAESIQNRAVLPGDFVEIRKGGAAICGIYTQSFDQAEDRLQSTSIVQGDQVLGHRTADIVFRIPGYIFRDHVKAKLGHWDITANPTTPPQGTGKVVSAFADQASLLMGTFYTRFNTLYDTFWHGRKQTMLTTPEAARYVFGKEDSNSSPLTLQELYATHVFLTQDSSLTRFVPSAAVRWTGEFTIRRPQEVLLAETVIDWVRKDDPRVFQFIQKAKELVEGSRRGDRSGWKATKFTDSDRTLIEFVRQTAISGYSDLFGVPQLAYLPRLLRPLGIYDDIDPRTAFEFLTEIGVWPRWYNMEINRSAISLTSGGVEEQAIVARIQSLNPESLQQDFDKELARLQQESSSTNATTLKNADVSKGETNNRSPLVLESPTEMYRHDPCDAIRHDFGHQPIYAIDDPSASELDDAFSIETVPVTTLTPEPSTWVHVHVADPTSILPPLHEMATLASERVQTTYLPEGTWPMLPRALTEETLSLKNDGRPKKVMTFSARLQDSNGGILEYKVRPGIVRKVVTLNYDDVDDVIAWDRVHGGRAEGNRVRSSFMTMPEDRALERTYYRSTKGSVSTDDTALVKELNHLQSIAQRHTDARLRRGAFNFSLGRPMIELTPYPVPRVAEGDWQGPIDYSHSPLWQEPQITVRLDPAFASPSRLMVAEYMIMAGRVASMFAQENGLPTLFRNQPAPAEKYREAFEETIRTKTNPRTGILNMVDMLPLRPYIAGAEISTNPLGHWSMGIHDGYCKVTSPLRRYSDMIAHWQIKGALLNKHASSSTAAIATTPPIFSLDTLSPLAGVIRDRERMLGMLEARSVKYWLFEMLRRRIDGGMSTVFDGIILNPTADGYNVISTLLGFQTVVKAEPGVMGASKIGDRVIFEVDNCNPQRPYIGGRHLSMA
ncbi:hypothetical protein EC957_005085 [Mortierella hygrophila]|uniref:RNB domain-containing protein n=1 Tax=Mortierella hygrophila TaxID=979708 RepID=A0A9P6F1D5_9FUNG|nr:hypothetical protein EC957_005085 [Mortierella hygrophila]